MICLYWNIGKAILQKQEEEGWGAKVIDRMAKDLKDAFPDMSGFSPRNIKYMRKFAECWPDFEIVQRVVAQIPWRTNRMLLDKLDTQEERIWYAHKTIENGWSSTILDLQIQSKLIERTGKVSITSLLLYHLRIPIWQIRFSKIRICLISLVLICQGERLRLNVS